jgi:hypothetical protein
MDTLSKNSIIFEADKVFDSKNSTFNYQKNVKKEWVESTLYNSFTNRAKTAGANNNFSILFDASYEITTKAFVRLDQIGFFFRATIAEFGGNTPVVQRLNLSSCISTPFAFAQAIDKIEIYINNVRITEHMDYSVISGLLRPMSKNQVPLVDKSGGPYTSLFTQLNAASSGTNKICRSFYLRSIYRNDTLRSDRTNGIFTPLYIFSNFFSSENYLPPGVNIKIKFTFSKKQITTNTVLYGCGASYQATTLPFPTAVQNQQRFVPSQVTLPGQYLRSMPVFLVTPYVEFTQSFELEIMKRWQQSPWINNYFTLKDVNDYMPQFDNVKTKFRFRLGIDFTTNTFLFFWVGNQRANPTGYDSYGPLDINLVSTLPANVAWARYQDTTASSILNFQPFYISSIKITYESSTEPIFYMENSDGASTIQEHFHQMTRKYMLKKWTDIPISYYGQNVAAPVVIPLNQESIVNANNYALPINGNYFIEMEMVQYGGAAISSAYRPYIYVAEPTTCAIRMDREVAIYPSPFIYINNEFTELKQESVNMS